MTDSKKLTLPPEQAEALRKVLDEGGNKPPPSFREVMEEAVKSKPRPPRRKRKQLKHQYSQQPKFKMSRLRKLIHKLTGRLFHYHVSIHYSYGILPGGQWSGSEYVSRSFTIGLIDPAILHHDHALRLELAPAFVKQIPKQYLRNGIIQLDSISFLGIW